VKKNPVYQPGGKEGKKGLKKLFDGGIRLVLDRSVFLSFFEYIQINAFENDICEYRNVEQFFHIKSNQICCPLLL